MKSFGSAALAALVAGSSLIASAPAQAGMTRDAYIQNYYGHHPRDRGYWQWRNRHSGWDRRDYGRWYYGHRGGDAAAAALFGLAAGALLGGIVAASADPAESHVRACSELYRSYNRETDTYLGYDWNRHPCTAF
jgi:hypothetical protein